MVIILDTLMVPEKGWVNLNVKRSFEIKLTAEEARLQVNRWLLNEVSYMFGAEAPTLVIGEQIVWRVPARYSAPHAGRVGLIGSVDVNVNTGLMDTTPELKAKILQNAEELAAKLPPYQAKETPQEYLSKNVPLAPVLIPNEDGFLVEAPAREIVAE